MPRARSLLLLIPVLMAAGCQDASSPARSGDTPEALLATFVRCVESLDAAGIEACFDVSSDPGRRIAGLLAASFRTARSREALDAAVRDKFGAAVAREMLGEEGAVPAALVRRVRALRERARFQVDGETARVEERDAEDNPRPEPLAVMSRAPGRWVFEVVPYLPDDPNLCANLVGILEAFQARHEDAAKAVARSGTPAEFRSAMLPIDAHLARAVRRAMVIVEPFLARYR